MGKLKLSFTTALFVFSFLICVLVAVVFVDRAPRNDYDAFYEDSAAADSAETKTAAPGWDPTGPAAPTPVTEPPAPVSQVEALLADLPIDTHLAGHAQPVTPAPTQAAAANPMAGKSPEEISRALLGQAGVQAQVQSASAIPGMALPPGIATPAAAAAAATATPAAVSGRSYLPMQSNVHGAGPGIAGSTSGLGGANPYGNAPGGITNASAWSPVAAQDNTRSLIGVHKAPSDNQQGMMIGAGHIESGVQPPAGFSNEPASAGSMDIPSLQTNPASSLPGSASKPLLLPPQQGSGMNKWELPPAPTLHPPPIQDPDNRRSEADDAPGSLNPEEASGQALAISQPAADDTTTSDQTSNAVAAVIEATSKDSAAAAPAQKPDPDTAAQVNEHILTKDAALRLARVEFRLKDKKLPKADEEKEAEKAAEQWKEIQAAAELARIEGLTVGVSELEHYASLRPDFEPAAWQLAMEEEGFSADVIRTNLESIALSEKLVENSFNAEVEEDEIRKAYDKAPSRYASPRKIRLQEIYKAKPADEDRAKRVASEMRRLQRQAVSGTDFGLLASQTSEAPTAKRGGDLGWIDPQKDKDAARDKALQDLEPGEVSEVLDETDGFRIYRLTAVREAAKDFDGARENVIAELKKPVRETTFADVLEKHEAGELVPATPAGSTQPQTAIAKANKAATPVVPTTVGASLVGGFEASIQPEEATVAASAPASDEAPASPADSADDMSDEQKKFLAQELLGKAKAKREAEERGEVYLDDTEMPQTAASTVMHQPGQQTQLLYAPGTQVQTMAGGQPAPAYQPGGMMAPPVQDNIQAPNQAVVNYGNNTPLMQAQMMQTAAHGGDLPTSAQQPTPARPDSIQTESNGWNVVKTTRENSPAQANPGMQAAAQPTQHQNAPARSDLSAVPPGFESTNSQANRRQQPSRGIVGSVKNFFGSIGR